MINDAESHRPQVGHCLHFSFSVLSRIIQLSPFLSLLSNTFGNIFAYFFNDAKVTYHSIGFLNSIHSYMFTSLNFSRLLFSYLQLIDNASTATLCHLRLWNRGWLQSNRWKLQNIQGWNYLTDDINYLKIADGLMYKEVLYLDLAHMLMMTYLSR